MAARHRLLLVVLVAFLALSTSPCGFGRRLVDNAEAEESSVQFEETDAKLRMLIEVTDYSDPVTGALLNPPPPSRD